VEGGGERVAVQVAAEGAGAGGLAAAACGQLDLAGGEGRVAGGGRGRGPLDRLGQLPVPVAAAAGARLGLPGLC
jgi:hypothetical protein